MAGLPDEVTDRAKAILKNLEGSELSVHEDSGGKRKGRIHADEIQMTLFEMKDDPLRDEISRLNVDGMTPLDALKAIADLQRKVGKRG
jgi:DNA mismatch repair protein MutS